MAVRVDEWWLRRRFKCSRCEKRLQHGDLTAVIIKRQPAPPGANQPPNTESQMVSYRNRQNHQEALVHRYVLPDADLGANGSPDPKYLRVNGVIYIADRSATKTVLSRLARYVNRFIATRCRAKLPA